METTMSLSSPVLLGALPIGAIGVLYASIYSRDSEITARQIVHDCSMVMIAMLQLSCLAVVAYGIATGVLAICDWRLEKI